MARQATAWVFPMLPAPAFQQLHIEDLIFIDHLLVASPIATLPIPLILISSILLVSVSFMHGLEKPA